VISIIADHPVDFYLSKAICKELWDAHANFDATNAGSELYVMEKFNDYKMADDRPVVEQAHEIHTLAKDLEVFKCELSNKFVGGNIISKLPPSWRDFVTSLKNKRQLFSVADQIGSLDVEEKARQKALAVKKQLELLAQILCRRKMISATPMVRRRKTSLKMFQRLNRQPPLKGRRRRTMAMCAVNLGPDHKGAGKTANMIIGEATTGTSG
jgi:hypothetical protein